MQHTRDVPRAAMDRRMDEKGRVLDGSAAAQNLAVQVDDEEVARLYLRPMQAEWRQEEPVLVTRHQQRQVVVDALVVAVHHGEAMAGGQIHPRTALGVCLGNGGLDLRIHGRRLREGSFRSLPCTAKLRHPRGDRPPAPARVRRGPDYGKFLAGM